VHFSGDFVEEKILYIWTSDDLRLVQLNINKQLLINELFSGNEMRITVKIIGPRSIPRGGTGNEYLLAMGSNVLEIIQNSGGYPKNRTITSLRGVVSQFNGIKCLVTYGYGLTSVDAGAEININWDVSLMCRLIKTGSVDPKLGDYKWVSEFDQETGFDYLKKEIIKRVKVNKGKIPVSFDLETLGLDPHNEKAYIITFQVSFQEGYSYCFYFSSKKDSLNFRKPHEFVKWLLTYSDIQLVGANLKFDCNYVVVQWGIRCTNFEYDTVVVGSLLHEYVSNSLNTHTKIYCPELGGYDDEFNRDPVHKKKSRMDLVPKDKILPYAGGDTDACLRIFPKMMKRLNQDKKQVRYYQVIMHPAIRAFEEVEQEGIVLDREYYHQLREELVQEAKEAELQAIACIPEEIKEKYKDNLKLSRPKLICDYLFAGMELKNGEPVWVKTGKGLNLIPKQLTTVDKKPSTSVSHLLMFEDYPIASEFISKYQIWSKTNKTITTYVDGFMKHIRTDGKFHPVFMLHAGEFKGLDSGSVSGRLGNKEPAFNTTPKHTPNAKRLRRAFVAPEGYVILEADYGQIELRICACVAHESNMIDAYKSGMDIHSLTASRLVGLSYKDFISLPDEEKGEKRYAAKAVNFGFIYGMQAASFMRYAKATYGLTLTLEEATVWRNKFFELYPGLIPWHKSRQEFIRANKYIQSMFGKVRHLPLAGVNDWTIAGKQIRSGINAEVQTPANDLSLWSVARVKKQYPETRVFGSIHDAILVYSKEKEKEMVGARVKYVMENPPIYENFGFKLPVDLVADLKYGPNWSDMTDLPVEPIKTKKFIYVPEVPWL
jgi:DNA polymerase I-like protein with 3'-5' exonuclease and polymerase domains